MGHIGRKGKRSMEKKVIDKSQAYEAYRLAWDDIAKLLSDQIKAVLGRRFLLRVWPEDQGYKGRSLSVSDVVEIFLASGESEFYYCEPIGFKRIRFEKE